MTALVTGGAASGKSALAEKLAVSFGAGRRGYFATMRVCDAECEARVARHRALRAGKGFETVECPFGVPEDAALRRFDTVLVECLSNLAANVMFGRGRSPEETAREILDGVGRLRRAVPLVVFVSNEIFSDGGDYDEGTRGYLAALGAVNRGAARAADVVVEAVCGIPVFHKGGEAVKDAFGAGFL